MTILLLAAVWCFGYAALCLGWAFGAPGFPFGDGDSRGSEMGSALAGAAPVPTGSALAAGCVLAGVVALSVLRDRRARAFSAAGATPAGVSGRPSAAGRWRGVVLLVAAVALVAVVPDVRLLQNLAYSLFGYFGLIDWPVLNQALCVVGAGLLARSGYVLLRSHPDATPVTPSRGDAATRWLRIGRWATLVAVLAPLPYAVQRAAWNLGIPLGVSDQFVRDLAADIVAKGLNPLVAWGLVVPDLLGALLTLGLVRKWGERFPSWVPLLGGRRVPVSLAVIPASVVSVAVSIAGLVIIRFAIIDGTIAPTAAPGLLWLPWGVALGVATFAYVERRRATRAERPALTPDPSAT